MFQESLADTLELFMFSFANHITSSALKYPKKSDNQIRVESHNQTLIAGLQKSCYRREFRMRDWKKKSNLPQLLFPHLYFRIGN